jgi:hypothetical protein
MGTGTWGYTKSSRAVSRDSTAFRRRSLDSAWSSRVRWPRHEHIANSTPASTAPITPCTRARAFGERTGQDTALGILPGSRSPFRFAQALSSLAPSTTFVHFYGATRQHPRPRPHLPEGRHARSTGYYLKFVRPHPTHRPAQSGPLKLPTTTPLSPPRP